MPGTHNVIWYLNIQDLDSVFDLTANSPNHNLREFASISKALTTVFFFLSPEITTGFKELL